MGREYVAAVIRRIESPGGTYMDLGYGVTLAHGRPEDGVHRTGMAMLLMDSPVHLNDEPDHPVRLVIALGASDAVTHQEMLADVASVLIDESSRERLLNSRSTKEIQEILRKRS